MSIAEYLSQPFWQRLGLTLVHFLWEGLAVAVLVGVFVRMLRLKHGNARYVAYLLAFIAMIACPVVTFTAIDIDMSANTEVVTGAESAGVVDSSPSPYTALPEGAILPEAELSSPAMPKLAYSIPLHERISGWLNVSMPFILVIWMVGVVVLSARLLMGFVGVYRWRHHLEALPERLAQRIVSLSEVLGMRRFSRVFISPTVLQAMAVGYLRPMVLLPVVMLTQMQPEMLEAVIAHELAHIRRFDLWVNLIQRITETLLFYHPAVWWLSNCIRRERELCCDELAVKATGERITYASTLESLGRARFMAKQSVLAAGLGQDNKPMLGRVRHILGLRPTQRNCPFWLAGVITVLFLAALVIPTTLALTNQSDEKLNDHSDAQRIKARLIQPEIIKTSDGRAKLSYFAVHVYCLDLAKLVAEKIGFITDKNITCDEDKNQISVVCPTTGDAETVLKFLQEVDLKPIRVQVDVHVVEAYSDVDLDWETRESVRNITRTKTASNAKPEKSLSAPDILRETAKAEPQPENSIEKVVDLLTSRGYLKILMNPRVEVINGKTARIMSSSSSAEDEIEITPHVFADQSVQLETRVAFTEKTLSESNKLKPIVNKKEIHNSENRIKSGESFVIGGITKTETRDIVRDGVKVSEERTTEVMVILTPTIITTEMNLSKKSAMQVSLPEKKDQKELSRFKKTLPHGVTVELIGMCEYPSVDKQWWRPDGSLLVNPPYDESDIDILSSRKPDAIPIEFAFRLSGNLSEPAWEAKVKGDDKAFVWWTGRRSKDGELLTDIKSIGMFVKSDQRTLDLRLGFSFADGPYEWVNFKNISIKPNFKPDVQVEVEGGWGEAVEGVQVRLRAYKYRWEAEEKPVFKADIRNRGELELYVHTADEFCQLEIDGEWHGWSGPWGLIDGKQSRFGHGSQINNISISLAKTWVGKKSVLALTAGVHTVRVAFVLQRSEREYQNIVRAVSNPVEIVILPTDSDVKRKPDVEIEVEKTSQSQHHKTLPNGVTVELLCLYYGKDMKDSKFWKPDGSLMSNLESRKYRESVIFPKWSNKDFKFEYGFMVRFNPLDGLSTDVFVKQGQRMTYSYPRSEGIAAALVASDWNDRKEGFSGIGNIKVAVASGPWDTHKSSARISEPSVRYLDDKSQIMFSPPRKTDEWLLDVTINSDSLDLDCFYELKEGSIHHAQRSGTIGNPNWIGVEQRTPLIIEKYSLSHEPEQIKNYIIKYRKFEIIEFENVSLKPNFKSDVQIEAEKSDVEGKSQHIDDR